MSALEIDYQKNEGELIAEIDDLSSYLRGIPSELRESGAFIPYEVRLQQLLETLLTLRLKQTLSRYENLINQTSLSNEQRAAYEEVHRWVRLADQRHEEAAHDYLRVVTLLNGLVAATGRAG